MVKFSAVVACVALTGCGGSSSGIPIVQSPPTSSGVQIAPIENIPSSQPATLSDPKPGPVLVPVPVSNPPSADTVINADYASLINGVRLGNGVGIVSFDARLGTAAQDYADQMLSEGTFSHVGSDGSTLGSRARAAGYGFSSLRENIASGQQSVGSVFNSWQNSPGHRANNQSGDVEDFGLGFARDGSNTRWVLVLGSQ